MNGTKILLDTNAIIALLQGNTDIVNLISQSENVYISIISVIEFISYSDLSNHDKMVFDDFCKDVEVIGLNYYNSELINSISGIRIMYKLKTPDAIIVATSKYKKATLVSNDKVFKKIQDIDVIQFNLRT